METIKKGLSALALSSVAHAATMFKTSFIWGSYASFFSLSHCMNPVIGKRGGGSLGLIYYSLRTLIVFITKGAWSLYSFTHHFSTLFGVLYASAIYDTSPSSQAILKRYALAASCLGCMLLFTIHPIGLQAWPYACLWILPLANALIVHNNMFINALASTFAAHAIGSVLWLYTLNSLTPAMWISLIPIACLERMVFATGACILDRLYTYSLYKWNTLAVPKHGNVQS